VFVLWSAESDCTQGVCGVYLDYHKAFECSQNYLHTGGFGDDIKKNKRQIVREKAYIVDSYGVLLQAYEDFTNDLFFLLYLYKFHVNPLVLATTSEISVIYISSIAKKAAYETGVLAVCTAKHVAVEVGVRILRWMVFWTDRPIHYSQKVKQNFYDNKGNFSIALRKNENLVIETVSLRTGNSITGVGPYNGHNWTDIPPWPNNVPLYFPWKRIRKLCWKMLRKIIDFHLIWNSVFRESFEVVTRELIIEYMNRLCQSQCHKSLPTDVHLPSHAL